MEEISLMLINHSCNLSKINKLRIDVSKYVGRFRNCLVNFCMHSTRAKDIFIQTIRQLENAGF